MIVSFEGPMGSAKTTSAVVFGTEEAQRSDRKIISNMKLNWPNYQHFSIEWFLDHYTDTELEDCILILDEMYQLLDSRNSQSKINKLMTYFIVQTRKRGVDLYLCTHHLDHVDLRLRRAVDIRGACKFIEETPCSKCKGKSVHRNDLDDPMGKDADKLCPRCKGYEHPRQKEITYGGIAMVYFLDRRMRRRYQSPPIWGPDYWHIFNTKEKIGIQQKFITGIDTVELGAS